MILALLASIRQLATAPANEDPIVDPYHLPNLPIQGVTAYSESAELPGIRDMLALVDKPKKSSKKTEQAGPIKTGQFRVIFQDSSWPAVCMQSAGPTVPCALPLPGTWVRVIGRKNITLIVELITQSRDG